MTVSIEFESLFMENDGPIPFLVLPMGSVLWKGEGGIVCFSIHLFQGGRLKTVQVTILWTFQASVQKFFVQISLRSL